MLLLNVFNNASFVLCRVLMASIQVFGLRHSIAGRLVPDVSKELAAFFSKNTGVLNTTTSCNNPHGLNSYLTMIYQVNRPKYLSNDVTIVNYVQQK
jgi:hypothetical protein